MAEITQRPQVFGKFESAVTATIIIDIGPPVDEGKTSLVIFTPGAAEGGPPVHPVQDPR